MIDDNLTVQKLHAALDPRPFRYFPQVLSTNDLAQAWLREGADAGAVVIADEQLQGRGRLGRFWHTPPGVALAFSAIIKPPPDALHQVTLLGAVIVAEALTTHLGAARVGIKWANDVQVDGRKICGILSEVVWEGDQLKGVILGIGVNVRVDFDTDADLAARAISLEPALGQPVDRVALMAQLMARLAVWMPQLGTPALFEAWRGRLNTLGQTVSIQQPNGIITGIAQDVDAHGALRVQAADGTVHRVIAGDLSIF